MIRTVLGDIPAETLGHSQCHEHLFIQKGKSFDVNPALCIDDMEKTLTELFGYRRAGGTAVVDAQPVYCGRMAERLTEASVITGVHIIAVTGFHRRLFYEDEGILLNKSEKELACLFAGEIGTGMLDETGRRISARAGLVKVALETGGVYADSESELLFGAAAQAASMTNAPVLVHTEPNAPVLEMIRFFESAGVSPDRLIICHLDRTRRDEAYHKEILSVGAYLCYDSVNRLKYLSHEQEISLIQAMVEAGYENRIMLSLDTTRDRLLAYGGYMGLDYILTEYIKILRENGVADEAIRCMTSENAKQALRIE